MKKTSAIGLFLIMLVAFVLPIQGAIPAKEREALIALYNGTNGDHWVDKTNWKKAPLHADGFAMPGTEGTWFGITVTADHVTQVHLDSNSLQGTVPDAIGDLASLESLHLGQNHLTGAIPAQIGDLTSLEGLDLSYNDLTGAIPFQIGNLANLKGLGLNGNDFTGVIPAEIGDLTNLTGLGISSDQLTGPIPPEIGNLTNLKSIYISGCQLTGIIPPEIGNLINLTSLFINGTQISGAIPAQIGNLLELTSLNLNDNRLTGSIPPEIGNLKKVDFLEIENNQLSGAIPAQIGGMTDLTFLFLSHNQLTGTIPPELCNLPDLGMLYLDSNLLSGAIPAEIGNFLTRLSYLDLSNNRFSGAIPAQIGKLARLYSLHLENNSLTGAIPTEIGNLANLEYLYLDNNRISGSIPGQIGDLFWLKELSLRANRLTGAIPPEIGKLGRLYRLYLDFNQLTGAIPPEIGNITYLYHLYLNSNRLSGEVPAEMANLIYIHLLDVGYNCLVATNNPPLDWLSYLDPDWQATQCLASITVTSPDGGENWNSGDIRDITWDSTDAVIDVNIDYSANNGGSWSPVAGNTANDGVYAWTVPATPSATCLVRISDAADGDPFDVSNGVFSISSATSETVSTPNAPVGPFSGLKNTTYWFSCGGSSSNFSDPVQYKFDWDDGNDSGWLAQGITSASHSWSANGTYHVRAMARCVTHTAIESIWSATHAIVISDSGTFGYYNSPNNRLLLPEATWAPASGGGDWTSELQLCDVNGGSIVQVYYNTGTNRRGPFILWANTSGAAGSSVKFFNIIQTIDGLDSGAFTYYGSGGALELVTQDTGHLIQAAVRSYNGYFSRTFPGLADNETNTAAGGRSLLIPNLSNDAIYRPSVVLFNPSADSVTAEVKILGSNGTQIGSTIYRTMAEHEQNTIVDEVRAYTYSNADILVSVTGGSGRLIASGQTANNASNDPAAHVAVQTASGYANSPADRMILPEVSWAPASGGGDWVTEVHIGDLSGGAVVTAYYNTGTSRRGPFILWTNSGGANRSVTFGNILQVLDDLDAGAFTYYGTGGSIEFVTQDGGHLLQAASRTFNGNFSRTFPGLQDREETTADSTRTLIIPNICNTDIYRPSLILFNPSADSVMVEVKIIGSDGAQIGPTISRTLAGHEQVTITDELRLYMYADAKIQIQVTSGAGRVIASGQSANNASNDPAAHVAVQDQ